MATTLRLRGLAFDAFTIFVEESDDCIPPGEECPDEPRFPGRRKGATVTVNEGAERAAWERLHAAANSADDSDCPQHRDALTALAKRLGPLVWDEKGRPLAPAKGYETRGSATIDRPMRKSVD